MASQSVMVCQLCEAVNTKITAKCLDCDLYICLRCKEKVHSKFKHADLHQIVGLDELTSGDIQNSTNEADYFKPVKCTEHKNQVCFMCCVECVGLVCATCISTKHLKHELSEIDTFCHGIINYLNRSSSEINTRIEKLIEEIEKIKIQETAKFSQLRDQMIKDENGEKERIRLQYEEKLKLIETERQESNHLLTTESDSVLENQMEIENINSDLKTALESNDPMQILKIIAPSEAKLKALSLSLDDKEAVSLQARIGKYKIRLEIIRSITTPSCFSTSSDKDGYIWIADRNDIIQMDPDNSMVLNSYNNPGSEIPEIRCSNTTETILFLTSSTAILKLTSDGEFNMIADFYPEEPVTIHVAKSGRIIVGMDLRCGESIDKPAFIVLELDGQKIVEYYNRGKLLIHKFVQCCIALEDSTLIYNDTDSSETGRTVKLDTKGDIQWVYEGQTGYSFFPVEVVSTKSNNIVVSEEHQNSLHVLTPTGDVLQVIDMTNIGIKPGCAVMTIDKDDHLWVSSGDTEMVCLEYFGF